MLTRRQKSVLPFLIRGKTVEAAARASGVPSNTIRKWLYQTEFVEVLDSLLDEQVSDACKQLGIGFSRLVPSAIETIESILKKKRGNSEVQLRAANHVAEKILAILRFQQGLRDRLNTDETS